MSLQRPPAVRKCRARALEFVTASVYHESIDKGGARHEFRNKPGAGAPQSRPDPGSRGRKAGRERQTISKWELDETLPDIRQSKRLAMLYRVTLDALIDFDIEAQELAEMTLAVPDEVAEKVDWTAV